MTSVGIIGCGGISRFHLEGYAKAGAKIAHVCDVREPVAASIAGRYGARSSTDYRAVINDKDVELVSVLVPASLHKDVCLAAIAAHKGVICEKTLTDNRESSTLVAHEAFKAGTFFATGFMKRYFPAIQQAKVLLDDMGEILSLYARTWQPFGTLWGSELGAEYLTHPSWVMNTYGGGVLVCGGSHILDLIHFFAGRPLKVSGQMRSRPGLDFDIQANAMLWLRDGGVAHFEALWHPFTNTGYERNGWDERLEINTAKGRLDIFTVKWDHPENNGALLVHQDAQTGRVTEYRYPAVNPFHIEIGELLRQFQAREPASPSARDGYVVDELIASIAQSSKEDGRLLQVTYADNY